MVAKKAAAKPAAKAPEPAVMAAGASKENAKEGKGMPPADAPAASEDEGSRNASGQFTGNPPSVEEKVDAIIEAMAANGWSLDHTLSHGRE